MALPQVGLLICLLWTASLVHEQSQMLPPTVAAPRLTPQTERAPDPVATDPAADEGNPEPTPTRGREVQPPEAPRVAVIDNERFFYADGFYAQEVQSFLDQHPGPLKSYRTSIGGREHSFAEFLISQTSLYSINPQVVLALIEQQSGLITQPDASPERMEWALNYHGEDERLRGFMTQVRWAIRELHRAQRDFPSSPELVYADDAHSAMPAGLEVGGYAIARVLAATTTPADLPGKLDGKSNSFVATFTRLFGDPRAPYENLPAQAKPFLSAPTDRPYEISSFFDHEAPFLQPNGSIVTYRGDRDPVLSYDGHDGWDYAAAPPTPVLAAAGGTVVFAGHSDDGCGVALAVIIDHGNGYRTLYWHLDEILVEPGPVERGVTIGIVGASGCVTGPHLHFQVQFLGRDTDPYGWCGPSGEDLWAAHPAGSTSTWLWATMPSPCDLPAEAIVVEPGEPSWRNRGPGWESLAGGVGGSAMLASSVSSSRMEAPLAVWLPPVEQAGRYRVMTWIPYIVNGIQDATTVRYLIRHAEGETEVVINQSSIANTWANLGVYRFEPGKPSFVGLAAVDAAAGTNVWFDAMVWLPEE